MRQGVSPQGSLRYVFRSTGIRRSLFRCLSCSSRFPGCDAGSLCAGVCHEGSRRAPGGPNGCGKRKPCVSQLNLSPQGEVLSPEGLHRPVPISQVRFCRNWVSFSASGVRSGRARRNAASVFSFCPLRFSVRSGFPGVSFPEGNCLFRSREPGEGVFWSSGRCAGARRGFASQRMPVRVGASPGTRLSLPERLPVGKVGPGPAEGFLVRGVFCCSGRSARALRKGLPLPDGYSVVVPLGSA